MPEDTDRPQDVGRRHSRNARRGRPDAASDALLDRYQATMRGELAALLDDLTPKPADLGLGLVPAPDSRLPIADRMRIWDLAIKLGRELGSAIDPVPVPVVRGPSPARRRARVDYGGE